MANVLNASGKSETLFNVLGRGRSIAAQPLAHDNKKVLAIVKGYYDSNKPRYILVLITPEGWVAENWFEATFDYATIKARFDLKIQQENPFINTHFHRWNTQQ